MNITFIGYRSQSLNQILTSFITYDPIQTIFGVCIAQLKPHQNLNEMDLLSQRLNSQM